LKVQDGFPEGEFQVEISVTSDEGPYTEIILIVDVYNNTQKLQIKKLSKWYKTKEIINTFLYFSKPKKD
jgi:hypothetical protein